MPASGSDRDSEWASAPLAQVHGPVTGTRRRTQARTSWESESALLYYLHRRLLSKGTLGTLREITLRAKRQVGTRGAHQRYRSHQAGDREMIRNDANGFMGPTPLSVLFQTNHSRSPEN